MSSPTDAPARTPAPRPPLRRRVRGRVLLLLCAFDALAYIDRGNIATAAPFIKADLHLTDASWGSSSRPSPSRTRSSRCPVAGSATGSAPGAR